MAGARSDLGGRDLVGAAHALQDGVALSVDQTGEQLLCVPEDQCPGEDLRRCVQRAQPWDELATQEQQTQEGGDGAGRQLERGERNGETLSLGQPRMPRMAAAAETAAAVSPMSSTTKRSRGVTVPFTASSMSRAASAASDVPDVGVPASRDVAKGSDCALGHTTTAVPDSSGAQHSGIMVG